MKFLFNLSLQKSVILFFLIVLVLILALTIIL